MPSPDTGTTIMEGKGREDMAKCKACWAWFESTNAQDICPDCKKALDRLSGYVIPADRIEVKQFIIPRPHRFMSNGKFLNFIYNVFPSTWCLGWGDPYCNSYIVGIPTVKEGKNG